MRTTPKRDTERPQAPHPWRKQVESNSFYRRRGWWHAAHRAALSPYEKAHWRQFFGWPPPLDTARLTELFTATFSERSASIAETVANGNALLRLLR